MCKIQTSKLTGTVHHENTRSQVSTDPPSPHKPSQQSRTHISLKHNKSQNSKKKEKHTKQMFFWLYNACLDTCVGQNKSPLGH